MGYGIAPNASHFTGKTKSKRKYLKKWKPKREHKNKYASEGKATKAKEVS